MKILFFTTFFLILAANIHAQEEKPQPKLNFAFMPESSPIATMSANEHTGYNKPTVDGFCGKLKDYLDNYFDVGSDDLEISYDQRFTRFSERRDITFDSSSYGIECAASTITTKREENLKKIDGHFSIPFYASEIALLIKPEDLKKLQEGKEIKIGVIGNTTTSRIIDYVYPNAKLVPINRRNQVVENLNNGTIDAYSSDKIMLEELIYHDGKDGSFSSSPKEQGYIIDTDYYSVEPYGIVVYESQKNEENTLKDIVDKWIKSNEGREAIKLIDKEIDTLKEKHAEQGLISWIYFHAVEENRYKNLIVSTFFVLLLVIISLIIYKFLIKKLLKSRKTPKVYLIVPDNIRKEDIKDIVNENIDVIDFEDAKRKIVVKENEELPEEKSAILERFLESIADNGGVIAEKVVEGSFTLLKRQ